MLKIFKLMIVAGLCGMTSGCFVAPIAGLALKPIISFATSPSDDGKKSANSPISVDQLLTNARGDTADDRALSPEAKAIAAAMAADARPQSDNTPKAVSVADLLQQARVAGHAAAKTDQGKTNATSGVKVRLSDILTDGSAFLRLQMTINGWAKADQSIHVSLGMGEGTVSAISVITNLEQLRQICSRLNGRCTPETALLQTGLDAGWVRLSPGKRGGNA